MIDDITIREYVESELSFDPSLDARGLAVRVSQGVVTLSGHVASYPQKLAAEAIARRTRGVRAVADNIEVWLPNDGHSDDGEIAGRAANLLEWLVTAPKGDVSIVVEDGWVTLQGSVGWTYQKEELEQAVLKLVGVRGGSNRIVVASHPAPATARESGEQIRQALTRNAEIDAERIKVQVDDGRITLSGKVKAWNERTAAARAAASVAGAREVVDEIVIG